MIKPNSAELANVRVFEHSGFSTFGVSEVPGRGFHRSSKFEIIFVWLTGSKTENRWKWMELTPKTS